MSDDNKKQVVVVNTSIDENKVVETNNKIKTKEIPFFVKFLSVVLAIMAIFFASFYAIKYAKKFITAGEATTTTTTTSSALSRSQDYWKKDTVRRYINNNTIYLFLPRSTYDKVIEISTDNTNEPKVQLGVYDDYEVIVSLDDAYEYNISTNGITFNNTEYKMSSGEFKYYINKDNESILIINASKNSLVGVYIDSDKFAFSGKYMEYDDSITITGDSGTITFMKDGNLLDYNGNKLTLAS